MKKVITYGSFDLFHEGHYNLLKRAKALGDYLIVGVTTEQYDESRGKLNIVDSLDKRIENVRQTGFADEDYCGRPSGTEGGGCAEVWNRYFYGWLRLDRGF